MSGAQKSLTDVQFARELESRGAHRLRCKIVNETPRVYQALCRDCSYKAAPGDGTATTAAIEQHARETLPAGVRETPTSARMNGDLAGSIVALARTAEKRRGTRIDLIEATDTIAGAIRKELRSGDRVTIQVATPKPNVKQVITYYAARARHNSNIYKEHDALIRDDAILGVDVTVVGHDWEWVPLRGVAFPGHIATDEERRAFGLEAAAVVAAFRALLESEARDNSELAGKVTKLTPR